jgi:hypothetical protein
MIALTLRSFVHFRGENRLRSLAWWLKARLRTPRLAQWSTRS